MKVKLQYFKPSGKYYASGSYETKLEQIWDIHEEVKGFWLNDTLPDLVPGARYDDSDQGRFRVYVTVPDHPINIPYLIAY